MSRIGPAMINDFFIRSKSNKVERKLSSVVTYSNEQFSTLTQLNHSEQCSQFIPPENTETQRFSGVFRGYKMGALARNWLRKKLPNQPIKQ